MATDLMKSMPSLLAALTPAVQQNGLVVIGLRSVGVLVLLAGGWLGGVTGLIAASVGGGLVWLSRPHGPLFPKAAAPDAPSGRTDSGQPVMADMVADVVDVWNEQSRLGRELNKAGLDELLQTFSGLSELMMGLTQQLAHFKPGTQAGAIGDAVDAHAPALAELLTPLQRAFAQRDAMHACVKSCTDTLGQLLQWSKRARELAQHTRMVAFNASIESARGHGQDAANMAARQTISVEIRGVSQAIIALCDGLDALVRPLHEAAYATSQDGLIQDTTEEELRIELEWRARKALSAMFESMGASLTGAREIGESADAIQARIDDAFTQFQFGDRVEQILQIVSQDMDRLARWARTHPSPGHQDAVRWLQELESKYTMDEQRALHHETDMVDRSGRLEFF